jgi:hypothetical protein
MTDVESLHDADHPDERPPGFRSWKSVYGFVIGVFVLKVALLALFTWTYAQ